MLQNYIQQYFYILFVVLSLFILSQPINIATAQTVKINGFIKTEYLYDTRQVTAARDGEFLLYPSPRSNISSMDNLGAFAFFSRVGLIAQGFPSLLGAKVTGLIEADFFGATNDEISTLRLRRASINLKWENLELLLGQQWSPLFAPFPRTVSTNTGVPFQPFARQPQIRLTMQSDKVRLIGAAAWQRDGFSNITFSYGEYSTSGVEQQQLSAIPASHLHIQYLTDKSMFGVGGYIKSVRPVPLGERFFTGAVQGYFNYLNPNIEVRGKVTYGGDLTDHLMTGGYVFVPENTSSMQDFDNDNFYVLNTFAGWIDINTKGTVAPGLFVAYLTNLGSWNELPGTTALVNSSATRGANIDYVWRLSPRLALNYGALRFAFEVELTTALYTNSFNERFKPKNQNGIEPVTNVRGNVSVYLFF